MRRFFSHPYLGALLFGLVTLYFVDWAARTFSLYFIFYHLDKFVHTIAGMCLGLFAWMVTDVLWPKLSAWKRLLVVLGFSLAFGAFWEFKEFIFNNWIGGIPFDRWDTTTDILCDTLGGLISFIYLTYL